MYDVAKGRQFEEETATPEGTATWKGQLDKYAAGNPSEWVTGAVFGGTYERPGLKLRDRQMLTMAALAAMGGVEPQLTGHIATAYKHAGMSKEEIAECFVHLMPYIGVPKTLAAMRCMDAALKDIDE
ncbi:carboxymuconolactone decarboxylase [Actinobaculum suis]|uniref:carboxymuconolactone decarboxylase family protein n=1 Tax=Actinobaculum suis TaxID=1657 RepID=UPI00066FDF00|nr:carboxymuconolactone decarboxylase family protein [Actinobaculum suis]KMY23457.1 carboxymuconolactone decarboxylase [Actinobaculum suis]